MSTSKLPIHIRQTTSILDENDVLLHEATIKKLKIPVNKQLTLRFGSSKTIVTVISHTKKQLSISRILATKLSLYNGATLSMQYIPAMQQLNIGPIIAVLMSRYSGKPSVPFSTHTAFCQELSEASRQHGAYVYFITPNRIDTSQPVLDGWRYVGGWKRMSFPYPDVIYNRLTSRKYERLSQVQDLFNIVKKRQQGHIFNEKFLNKSEVFQALAKEPTLKRYLPATNTFQSYQTLKTMCARFPTVFLKPITGSLGKGIIKVTRHANASFTCHFSSVNGTRKVSYPSLSKVFRSISGKMKVQRYQIQQGLNLITNHGRPIDFRALVQKSLQGEWKVTSIVARIAGSEHFVSNLARGGQLSTVKAAIAKSKLSPSRKKNAGIALKKAALMIANGIETHVPGHFGELGVDLAVDVNGRVWLLEVNSKPSKTEDTSVNQGKIRPSAVKVIHYARFLTRL